jgi:hypothetical protein
MPLVSNRTSTLKEPDDGRRLCQGAQEPTALRESAPQCESVTGPHGHAGHLRDAGRAQSVSVTDRLSILCD